MHNILSDVKAVLHTAGYVTHMPQPTSTSLYFEDSYVLGVVFTLTTVNDIRTSWETLQDRFLRENAKRLVLDPFKAWNCYTVLLTPESAIKEDATALCAIEEDFRGTRKIVRSGVSTRTDVELALAPLLPLRRLVSLTPENVRTRLAQRLGEVGSPLQALLSETPANRIASALVDPE